MTTCRAVQSVNQFTTRAFRKCFSMCVCASFPFGFDFISQKKKEKKMYSSKSFHLRVHDPPVINHYSTDKSNTF